MGNTPAMQPATLGAESIVTKLFMIPRHPLGCRACTPLRHHLFVRAIPIGLAPKARWVSPVQALTVAALWLAAFFLSVDRLARAEEPATSLEAAVGLLFAAQPQESAIMFDTLVKAQPLCEPDLWQRGLALYYGDRFADAQRQFELHRTVNPNDVENPAWHFACVARQRGEEAARQALLPVGPDPRVPLAEVLAFYRGSTDADAVLKAADAGPEGVRRNQRCYAHLYLGLHAEATGATDKAKNHMLLAAGKYSMDHFMGKVAQMHVKLRGWEVAQTDPLRVGMELSYPPFEMTDPQGRPTGVSVRLAEALGRYLGRTIVVENIAFDGLIPALKTGKIDCIISSMTATPQRAKSIAFSEPYLKTGLSLLVGVKSSVQAEPDLNVKGRVVAVKKGTTGHQYAATSLQQARVLVLDKESAAVMEVVQGKADVFLYDSLSVYQNHKRHPDQTRAILRPFREETWAVGVRQNDAGLRGQINAFLRAFREQGGFEKLGDEFLPEEKAAFAEQGIPFYF